MRSRERTKKLYDSLSRNQSSVLSQLRTGKNKLNLYLAKAKTIESEVCECGKRARDCQPFFAEVPSLDGRSNKDVDRV